MLQYNNVSTMLRCSNRGHMAPAGQFSLNRRGVSFKCCDTCRAAQRVLNAIRGNPRCAHDKQRTQCLVCCPASAFGYYTAVRASDVLGTKLPLSRSQLLGCSTRDYSFYIIGQFRDGMTLANHGVAWQLDHIVPIMQRDADGNHPDQATIISRFHFTNVQPVLIAEHRAKTIAENVARFRPPPPQRPARQLTDDEFDELMAALGIEM
jgi:hypothetical protein